MPTYDIAMFQPPLVPNAAYVSALATSNSNGRYVSGIEKLAQRFILELTTQLGTMPFAPTRGCNFMALLNYGGLLSEMDVVSAFNIALLVVKNNLRNEELETDPPEERFADANLSNITTFDGTISLGIQLITRSSTTGQLTLPISLKNNNF